jgi:hypothetical protein
MSLTQWGLLRHGKKIIDVHFVGFIWYNYICLKWKPKLNWHFLFNRRNDYGGGYDDDDDDININK